MEQSEEKYQRGFNSGYLLEEYEPALLAKVLHNLTPSTEYIAGLSDGQKEHQQERMSRELQDLSELRDNSDIERERE